MQQICLMATCYWQLCCCQHLRVLFHFCPFERRALVSYATSPHLNFFNNIGCWFFIFFFFFFFAGRARQNHVTLQLVPGLFSHWEVILAGELPIVLLLSLKERLLDPTCSNTSTFLAILILGMSSSCTKALGSSGRLNCSQEWDLCLVLLYWVPLGCFLRITCFFYH